MLDGVLASRSFISVIHLHLPRFLLLWLSMPQPLAYHSPTCGALFPSHLGCLQAAKPSPLPGTDLWNISLSTQPPPECLSLWYLCLWFR